LPNAARVDRCEDIAQAAVELLAKRHAIYRFNSIE
jgi:hypothetical protein